MKKLNKKGFTLIELLTAMFIVGVLSAIAIPSYRKMKANARTTEAKTHLGQLHIAEKSFFIQWGCYISDLKTIGFKPEGELLYNVGFNQATPDVTGGVVPTGHPCQNYNGPDITGTDNDLYEICGQQIGTGTKLKSCGFIYKGTGFQPPDTPVNSATLPNTNGSVLNDPSCAPCFTAVAIADVNNPLAPPITNNIWTIDNYKRIVQVQDIDGILR